MLISDWSSDVCSSGLIAHLEPVPRRLKVGAKHLHLIFVQLDDLLRPYDFQIGRYDVDECLRLDRAQVRPHGLDTAFGGPACRSPPPLPKKRNVGFAIPTPRPAAAIQPAPPPDSSHYRSLHTQRMTDTNPSLRSAHVPATPPH